MPWKNKERQKAYSKAAYQKMIAEIGQKGYYQKVKHNIKKYQDLFLGWVSDLNYGVLSIRSKSKAGRTFNPQTQACNALWLMEIIKGLALVISAKRCVQCRLRHWLIFLRVWWRH